MLWRRNAEPSRPMDARPLGFPYQPRSTPMKVCIDAKKHRLAISLPHGAAGADRRDRLSHQEIVATREALHLAIEAANMRPFWKMKNIVLALLLAVACFAQKRPITHEDIW